MVVYGRMKDEFALIAPEMEQFTGQGVTLSLASGVSGRISSAPVARSRARTGKDVVV
jgi:hypothetical protein